MKSLSRIQGFTLVELLVVISIIAILAGLSFAGIGNALNSARRVQAKNDCTTIATAVIAYETEYGRLPVATSSSVDGSFVKTLTGQDTNNNMRKIVFLEPKKAGKNGRGGTNSSGDYIDPWGNAYQIKMDTNYSGEIMGAGAEGNADLRRKVAVWCSSNTNLRVPVNSWD